MDGTGSGFYAAVNEKNRLLVDGVVSIDQVPTTSGTNPEVKLEYIISGTATGVVGSEIGSVIKYFGAGSFVQVLTYENNNLVNAGSFV